jgi:hypothetical protein
VPAQQQADKRPRGKEVAMSRLAWAGAWGGLLALSAAVAQPPPPPVFSDAVLEQFPVARGGALLVVPVTLGGKAYPFVLDTGATQTVYDTSLRPLLGPPLGRSKVITPGGDVVLEEFAAPDARLGKLPLPRGKVYLFEMSKLREAGGIDVRGILGMDFLRDYVVTIDFDGGTVAFRRLAIPNPGEALPLFVESLSRPCVRASLAGGPPELFMVDTGSEGFGSADVRPEQFDALVKAGKARETARQWCTTMAGTRRSSQGAVESLTVGPFKHRDLEVTTGGVGLLGLSYWSRYLVTFDFPLGVAYLKKGAAFDAPDERDRSGLSLLRVKGAVRVHGVAPGSPAERVGLRPGDVLLEVAGARADRGPLFPLRRLLAQDGRAVTVRFRRGAAERTVTLPLRDWRPPAGPAAGAVSSAGPATPRP